MSEAKKLVNEIIELEELVEKKTQELSELLDASVSWVSPAGFVYADAPLIGVNGHKVTTGNLFWHAYEKIVDGVRVVHHTDTRRLSNESI